MGKQTKRVFGLHAVRSLLARNPARVSCLLVLESRQDIRTAEILAMAEKAGVAVRRVTRQELDQRVPGVSHQGVLAETGHVPSLGEQDLPGFLAQLDHPAFVLVLDGVQDPHNLGACLRSADAAGVDLAITPRDRSAPLTATVRKVACGAADTVPLLRVTNLARTLRQLRDAGVWIRGAAGEAGTSLYDTDLTGPLALVLGGEGKGLRRLTREHCDSLMAIPLAGSVGSLNVSVAAGICLFEALRQRRTC
ncbi:MAG TPA: 23S rRNA (guanosine(2251)-2'-O)-methyltransferase RlmB [Gammaproteobacteria bacterium]|nr:23S rRNA (guanosine(2251)-2'-O)-methyltransferase RlmB [Gammaproteobacteria bacterium]